MKKDKSSIFEETEEISEDIFVEDEIDLRSMVSFGLPTNNDKEIRETINKPTPTVEERIIEIEEITEDNKKVELSILDKKINNIKSGDKVTLIYGDFENQKILKGKVISKLEKGITIMPYSISDNKDTISAEDQEVYEPVAISLNTIIDIIKVKRFKKKSKNRSLFKINKKIKEFVKGSEEDIKKEYEWKIAVKKYREQLKNKDQD